jgi:RNA polymerase sigma-70 factor (ECF subfamily)
MTELLARRLRPDRSFERLYRRHGGDVYRYALALLRNPADAEDVTQTTFLNAYRVYQRGERPREARNWLIAIAHNACRQRFRELRRRADEVALDDAPATAAVDEDVPRAADIQRALGNLRFNQRAALVMRELQGRTYAEIGEVLGISTGAVETLVFRARRALQEQLEGSLTCTEAELAVSRQLAGRLPKAEKAALRAHLRECSACASLARRRRARSAALRGLGAIPLPPSLASLFGGGAGAGLAAKTAAVVAAGALVGGTGYEAVVRAPWRASTDVAAPPATTPSAGPGQAASAHEAPAAPAPARARTEAVVARPARAATVAARPRARRKAAPGVAVHPAPAAPRTTVAASPPPPPPPQPTAAAPAPPPPATPEPPPPPAVEEEATGPRDRADDQERSRHGGGRPAEKSEKRAPAAAPPETGEAGDPEDALAQAAHDPDEAPGQARKDDDAAAEHTPPGQAKKDGADTAPGPSDSPPGRSKP